MLSIISPAKNLDEKSEYPNLGTTLPFFLEDSTVIMNSLKSKSINSLKKMMRINGDLASLNYERNQAWNSKMDTKQARPAIRMFRGDVYQGMKPWEWENSDYEFAQENLLILSGLHGILRPLDLIRPYRLEMGSKLKMGSKKNLYEYWGDKITEKINDFLSQSEHEALINLSSKEYFASINPAKINGKIIEVSIVEYRNGEYKFMSFFGKKARGFMAGAIVKNRITNPEDLKGIEVEGYKYTAGLSTENNWVFSRKN